MSSQPGARSSGARHVDLSGAGFELEGAGRTEKAGLKMVCVGVCAWVFSRATVGTVNNGGVDKGPSYTCSA